MISTLATVYLFCGGVGAGALCLSCLLDIFLVHEPFGGYGMHAAVADASIDSFDPRRRVAARVFAFATGLLLFGALCLMADLGRIDRVQLLFFSPSGSVMSVGAWSLAVLIVLALYLTAVRFLQLPHLGRTGVVVLEAVAAVVGLVVMAYTGILLADMVGVALWACGWTPILFVLSSLSGGCGVIGAISSLTEFHDPYRPAFAAIMRFDMIIIALELVVFGIFVVRIFTIDNSSMQATRALLTDMTSSMAELWWIGFLLIGMVIPAILELFVINREREEAYEDVQFAVSRGIPVTISRSEELLRRAMLVCSAATLVGALCFRFAITGAGEQRVLELADTPVDDPAIELVEPVERNGGLV